MDPRTDPPLKPGLPGSMVVELSCMCAFVRFREELKRITDAIVQRNKERESEVKYEYLLPTNIANNINI